MGFVGPFPQAQVIERLRERVPLARVVGNAADLDAALNAPPNAAPALYVTATETGGEAKYSGSPTIQNATVQLAVVLLVRNSAGERTGSGARALADQVIAQVRAALIGWTPDDAFNAITFQAGRDDRYVAGWYAGQQIFRTDYRIRNDP